MGYLEDLKRQADEALARQSQDTGALERNALVTDSACQSAARYLASLARQLNVLQPLCRAVFRFDNRHTFSQLRFSDFRSDSRLRVGTARPTIWRAGSPASRAPSCATAFMRGGSRPDAPDLPLPAGRAAGSGRAP